MSQSGHFHSSANSGTTAAALLSGIAGDHAIDRLAWQKSFADISLDSRTVARDGLFLAMPGLLGDGRDYSDKAIQSGAAAIIYEAEKAPAPCQQLCERGLAVAVEQLLHHASLIAARFFDYPSKKLNVIGVTGTNGKTTCVYLLAQALDLLGQRAAIMGTIGTGPIEQLEDAALTTADAVTVQRTLDNLYKRKMAAVCMEVSSHGLDQGRVNAVDFDVALFTNLSQDHLDYHGDMQQYAEAKKRLFRMHGLNTMVVNADDQLGRQILAEYGDQPEGPRVISYGIGGGALRAHSVVLRSDGIRFRASYQGQQVEVQSKLIGEINLPNLLGVMGCLLAQQFSLTDIAGVMPGLAPPPGRMEMFTSVSEGPVAVVDYSHTPDSLQRALQSLRQHVAGQVWLVFGCGGDRDRGKRRLMGEVAARLADHIVVTNDNPRSESPDAIAADIVVGIEQVEKKSSTDIYWKQILDRRAAITYALEQARPGDLVLVAGKGHERTQTIGDQVLPFSDRDLVADLMVVAT